jgi:uncharacterized OsmC-like protein
VYGDEPAPLGKSSGPSPSQLLAAAVGNCLADSLLFALRKFKQRPEPIGAAVAAVIDRNDSNRLRVTSIDVKLTLGVPAENLQHLERALSQFEEFCTVSQSVQQGIPISVTVYDSSGRKVK